MDTSTLYTIGAVAGALAAGLLGGFKGARRIAAAEQQQQTPGALAMPPSSNGLGLALLTQDHANTKQLVTSVQATLGEMNQQLDRLTSEVSDIKASIARLEGFLEALGRQQRQHGVS